MSGIYVRFVPPNTTLPRVWGPNVLVDAPAGCKEAREYVVETPSEFKINPELASREFYVLASIHSLVPAMVDVHRVEDAFDGEILLSSRRNKDINVDDLEFVTFIANDLFIQEINTILDPDKVLEIFGTGEYTPSKNPNS